MNEQAKFWQFDDLQMLRATYITHAFKRHIHEGFAIGMIERGEYEFYYRHAMHLIRTNEIVVINPGEVHTGQAVDDVGWSYRMFYPGVVFMRQIACEITGKQWDMPYFDRPVIPDYQVAGLLRRAHIMIENPSSRLEAEALLRLALGQLIVRHAVNRPLSLLIGDERLPVQKVREYLEAHYHQNPSLETLAEIAGLSPYHLVRVFRKEMGLPPHTYLTNLRVTRAKTLLSAGYPISEVALLTGFADQSHLSRHFKQIIGVPPGHYGRSDVYAAQ